MLITQQIKYFPNFQVGTDPDGEEDCLFFIWPTTIVHKIDEESPFYSMNARFVLKSKEYFKANKFRNGIQSSLNFISS